MAKETATVAVEETAPETAAPEATPAPAQEAPATGTEATEGEAADEPASTEAAQQAKAAAAVPVVEPMDNRLKINKPKAPVTDVVKRLMDQLDGQVKRAHSMREGIFSMLKEGNGKFSEGQEAYFTRFASNLRFIGTQAQTAIGILDGSVPVDNDGDAV